MPRNRTARLAVLGSTVQHPAGSHSLSRSNTVLRRRVTVGVLVGLSLLLITLSFREPATGGVHELQGVAATALRPLQVGIERVVRPFRDAYGWAAGLLDAKSENERLKREVARWQREAIQYRAAYEQNQSLKDLLDYRGSPTLAGYDTVAAEVIAHPHTHFEQRVVISAGSRDGIGINDPVVNGDGLVGKVTQVAPLTAEVTLLTDDESAVSALDVRTNAAGIVRHGRAGSAMLMLERVEKRYVVNAGDPIVTAGSQRGQLPSLYPRGILIGTVAAWGQSDIDLYKRIQVRPAVDFGALDAVIVLVPERRAR